MRLLFLDTFFLLAFVNPHDQWHASVLLWQKSLQDPVRLVTTHEVLTEFLAGVGGLGAYLRQQAVQTIESMRDDPAFRIIPSSQELFDRGMNRYRQRPDKSYSLTDCISMVIMEEFGITEILTNDHHFEQEGFHILIRR